MNKTTPEQQQQLRAGWTIEGWGATRLTIRVDGREVTLTAVDDDQGGGFASSVRLDPRGAQQSAGLLGMAADLALAGDGPGEAGHNAPPASV